MPQKFYDHDVQQMMLTLTKLMQLQIETREENDENLYALCTDS